ncbi:MAG: DUF58 domain-containing protein [Candidatus Velamenicoccus archaeovorus]
MPSGRGVLVFVAGVGLWLAARIAGSPALHIVAVGLVVLPFAAALFARWGRQHLSVRRRVSDQRVPPGRRVTVELEVENEAPTATSFLLLEDHVPSALGRPARLVVAGIPPRGKQRASYSLVAQSRGRYQLGPLTVDVADPFALTRLRIEFDHRDELVVTPEIEELERGPTSPFGVASGLSMARHLFRTGEEFYTMRPYQQGDDLRRIHWPSVARSGQLMIRQDESTRRSTAVLFLDTRESAVGQTHGPAFERCVSAAASVGVLLARYGFSIQLATSQSHPVPMTEDALLEALAGISHHTSRALSGGLTRLRSAAAADTTLVIVTAPPPPSELTSLVRAGVAFGPKLAILVYPVDPDTLPPERQSQLEGRASAARLSLSRAGWEVLVLPPSGRLREVWQRSRTTRPALSG